MKNPVPGYSGWEASPNGQVFFNGKEVIPNAPKVNSYTYVYDPVTKKSVKRAKLVCLAFNGPKPFLKAIVRHWDDNKHNDRAENLLWGSRSQNMIDSLRNGTRRSYEIDSRDLPEGTIFPAS